MSSFAETLHRAHLERKIRFMEAALNPKAKAHPSASYDIPNAPLGVPKVQELPPRREPVKRRGEYYVPRQADEIAWRHEICGVEIPSGWSPNADVRRLTIEDIQRAVAEHCGVSRNDIISDRRTADVVRPRQLAAYLAKRLTTKSLPEIGRHFGGRDHTTILHSVRNIAKKAETDPALMASINTLVDLLGGDPQ